MSNGSTTLTASQIAGLARPIVAMADLIAAYYQDPAHEQEFQDWYLKRYGEKAPKGV